MDLWEPCVDVMRVRAALDGLAARLQRAAAEADELAAAVRRAAPGADWHGPGAERADDAVRRDAYLVLAAAEGLLCAAGLVRGLSVDLLDHRADGRRAVLVRPLLP